MFCCDGEFPTESDLKILKKKDESSNSGLWKPDSKKYECGTRNILGNIVGGSITQIGELPYMALLGYDIDGKVLYVCGGSLINKWYVLTAAHCMLQGNPRYLQFTYKVLK